MSTAYDVGFTRKPELTELDGFMKSLGFEVESPSQRRGDFIRVYVLCDDSAPREIEFFYEDGAGDYRDLFGERGKEVYAYGNLKTFSTEMTHPDLVERLRIIEEKCVRTQHDYYRHLDPERLKFYETALALRDQYDAIVVSEQTREEINPDKPFPEKQ